jgi:hypothetical protein
VKVIAVENVESAEPAEAILVNLKHPERGLIRWWEGMAQEALSKAYTVERVLSDPSWRQVEIELPRDWESGYLRIIEGRVEFVHGRPSRKKAAP